MALFFLFLFFLSIGIVANERKSNDCNNKKAKAYFEKELNSLEIRLSRHLLNSNYRLIDLDFAQAKTVLLFSVGLKITAPPCLFDKGGAICKKPLFTDAISTYKKWYREKGGQLCYHHAKKLVVKN